MSLWQVTIKINHQAVDEVVNLLESQNFHTISWFEDAQGPMSNLLDDNQLPIAEFFNICGYLNAQPSYDTLHNHLTILSMLMPIDTPTLDISKVDKDVSYIQKNPFKKIGRFRIKPYEAAQNEAKGTIDIYLSAAMAFGTGEHPTTAMCLLALEQLNFVNDKKLNILDMGCGSGVLAIASNKLWPNSNVLAVDIDPVSVMASQNNAKHNKAKVTAIGAHTPRDPIILQNQYDLILANILCKPLCVMAKDFAHIIKPNGYLIISGFLDTQANILINNFNMHKFKVINKLQHSQWVAMILQKI